MNLNLIHVYRSGVRNLSSNYDHNMNRYKMWTTIPLGTATAPLPSLLTPRSSYAFQANAPPPVHPKPTLQLLSEFKDTHTKPNGNDAYNCALTHDLSYARRWDSRYFPPTAYLGSVAVVSSENNDRSFSFPTGNGLSKPGQ